MKKICFALTLLLCCGSAFAFDPVAGDITTGFSRDNRLEVVKDDIYRLMWQDGAGVARGYYNEAVKYCENLKFAGYSDWRLPTINELLSITDDSRYNPAINKAFKNVAYETNDKGEKRHGWYWSSTRSTGASFGAWFVLFRDGADADWLNGSASGFVRCVRDY